MTEKTQPLQAGTMTDADCNITISGQEPIANYPGNVSGSNTSDAENVITQLTFADIWRVPPFRFDYGSVYLAVMAVLPDGGRNWQVQIKDQNGAISTALVQGNLVTASTDERRQYVQSMVRQALQISLNSRKNESVEGPCR